MPQTRWFAKQFLLSPVPSTQLWHRNVLQCLGLNCPKTPYTQYDVANFQTHTLTLVNEEGYFLELFFQKSSRRQCWGPQSQPTGPQCAFVTFNINGLCNIWVAPKLTTDHCALQRGTCAKGQACRWRLDRRAHVISTLEVEAKAQAVSTF